MQFFTLTLNIYAIFAHFVDNNVQILHNLYTEDVQMTELKRIRNARRITQQEAAELIGISLRSYVTYENDERKEGSAKYRFLLQEIEKNNPRRLAGIFFFMITYPDGLLTFQARHASQGDHSAPWQLFRHPYGSSAEFRGQPIS